MWQIPKFQPLGLLKRSQLDLQSSPLQPLTTPTAHLSRVPLPRKGRQESALGSFVGEVLEEWVPTLQGKGGPPDPAEAVSKEIAFLTHPQSRVLDLQTPRGSKIRANVDS